MSWQGFYSTPDNVGDYIDANVTTVVGVIEANVSANATEIVVSDDVMENVYNGYSLDITDSVNTNNLGEILAVHTGNNTIAVTKQATQSFSTLSPTNVEITSRIIRELSINCGRVRYGFAEKKIGGRSIPPNTPLSIIYTNADGNAKQFTFNVELLY